MVAAGERDEVPPPVGALAGAAPAVDDGMSPSRALGAWRAWLAALATDAEAALAAAMTYAALEGEGRDAWLDALERDRRSISVPEVALYAPLLAVEADPQRRARIAQAMGDPARPGGVTPTRAWRGATRSGDVVCAIARPLYLDFVELLVCRYHPDRGVTTAHHEPFRHAEQLQASVHSALEQPIELAPVPLRDVIEELAHAVVADRRQGRVPPETLSRFSHLFGPDLEEYRSTA